MSANLDRIRALLAKAEDKAASPHEAEAYAAKAAELMAKYGVDRMMLAVDDPTSDVVGDRVVTIEGDTNLANERQRFLSQLAMAMGARVVLRTAMTGRTRGGNPKMTPQVHLFGYASDLERIEILYTSLLVQSANGMAHAETEKPAGEWRYTFLRSWLRGFARTVVYRVTMAERNARHEYDEQRTSGPSTDLVIIDRTALVKKAVADAYPKLGTARTRETSGSGYSSGSAAGRNADIGARRVGAGQDRRLGS